MENINDILNTTIGELYIDSIYSINGQIVYSCICSCGKHCYRSRDFLLNYNYNKSCGHDIDTTNKSVYIAKAKARESTNEMIRNHMKYHHLTVLDLDRIEQIPGSNKELHMLKCKCDCGEECIVEKIALRTGAVRSCHTCMDAYNINPKYKQAFMQSYHAMKQRCNDKSNPDYGGRGITYDPRWNYFPIFKKEMFDTFVEHFDKYGRKNTTIDRDDYNGNYNATNCKWSTLKEQANNKRNNTRYQLGEINLTPSEYIDTKKFVDPGITYEMLRNRMRNSKYTKDGKIIDYNVFRNESYRATLQKPIRIISMKEKEKYTNMKLPNDFTFKTKDDLNNS